jgi:hypothetical protein
MIKTLSPICFALMTPNWVIAKLHLPRLSHDWMSPSLCGGTGKRKSDCVKFAILALTATQTVPQALLPRTRTGCLRRASSGASSGARELAVGALAD